MPSRYPPSWPPSTKATSDPSTRRSCFEPTDRSARCTTLGALAATVAACEIGLRCYHRVMANWRTPVLQEIVLDSELGWRATENYSFSGQLRDHTGNPYRAEVSTDGRGFRVFGDPSAAERPKVPFLGDSFTHAIQVSAGAAYYSIVGRALDFETSAYGVGGWGTLQELMVLRGHLDLVEPDAVVLQFCSNDLFNNYYGLELGSSWSNNGLVRPYWEEGAIVYRLPGRLASLRRFANEHSEFLFLILSRFDRIVAAADRPGFELRVAAKGLRFPPFAQTAAVTTRLLREIRAITPAEVPVFAFCTDDPLPEFQVLRSSSGKAGLVFIDGVPEVLREAESSGICIRAADGGHWNQQGHRLVAKVLSGVLARELIASQSQ